MIEANTWQRLAVRQKVRHETFILYYLFNKNQDA